jgi:hypothetical protein
MPVLSGIGVPHDESAEVAELARELESRQPDRWTRPVFTSS